MTEFDSGSDGKSGPRRFGCLQVLGFMVVAAVVTALATFFFAKYYLFRSEFTPVVLNATEKRALDSKLARLDDVSGRVISTSKDTVGTDTETEAKPEPYSESGARRTIVFTERELNALIAQNTDLAKKLVIDLSDDLISAKLILPIDEDFPVLGGKTLRVKAGVGLAYADQKPSVMLKGITLMGVPLPNAWLGGIKNMDLVSEFGADQGFWKGFADGVEDIVVAEGVLKIKLRE